MTNKWTSSLKELLEGLALLVGAGMALLLILVIGWLFVSSLVFVALTVFTDWGAGSRLVVSLVGAAFGLWMLSSVFDIAEEFIPKSWLNGKFPSARCPECNRRLVSDLAKQCLKCGADWHSDSVSGNR